MHVDSKYNGFDELPQVAMPFMNAVHQEELQLVNELLIQLNSNAPAGKIDSILSTWIKHTIEHFEREENLMQAYSFPPYPVHKMEHEQVRETMTIVQQNWLDTRDTEALMQYIEQDWRPWLQHHILTMDRVTAEYLRRFDIQIEL